MARMPPPWRATTFARGIFCRDAQPRAAAAVRRRRCCRGGIRVCRGGAEPAAVGTADRVVRRFRPEAEHRDRASRHGSARHRAGAAEPRALSHRRAARGRAAAARDGDGRGCGRLACGGDSGAGPGIARRRVLGSCRGRRPGRHRFVAARRRRDRRAPRDPRNPDRRVRDHGANRPVRFAVARPRVPHPRNLVRCRARPPRRTRRGFGRSGRADRVSARHRGGAAPAVAGVGFRGAEPAPDDPVDRAVRPA